MSHTPVLLKEVIEFLDPHPGAFIIDATVDGGGHAEKIVERIAPSGKLLGIDLDNSLVEQCRKRFSEFRNVAIIQGNYSDLPEILDAKKLPKADGLLLDLGFSSAQLVSGKGFSFEKDEPLMMTYDEASAPVKEILKKLDERELADVIYELSGERFSRRIAKAIKERMRKKSITTTSELRDAITSAVPRSYERGRIDPATRTFQALRIYANDELGNLEKLLRMIPKIVSSGGRAAIISFHSLEDRLVKNYFRQFEKDAIAKMLTKKPIVPTREEIVTNPRARSAKLRAAVII